MNSQLWQTASSVSIVLLGTALGWHLLSRVTQSARRDYEALLELASRPGASEGDLLLAQRRLTALRLVVNGARYALALIALLLTLDQLDVRIAGLLLPAGFAGAALGVGAQNVVRDLLAGLFFLFEAQFAVGDAVAINGVAGTVEEVGVRVTRLRDVGGQEHFFPNGAITTVARYPHRTVSLLLRLPLMELGQARDLEAAVQASHQDFAALFDRAASPPERLMPPDEFSPEEVEEDEARTGESVAPSEPQVLEAAPAAPAAAAEAPKPIAIAWWRWEVHPARAALWREKFAPQVSAQLRRAGLEPLAGEAEVLNAPADA